MHNDAGRWYYKEGTHEDMVGWMVLGSRQKFLSILRGFTCLEQVEKEGGNWLKPGSPGKNCIHFGPWSVGSFSVQLNKHQQYAIEVCTTAAESFGIQMVICFLMN